MRFAFLTNIVSPHQLPWCRAFAQLAGKGNFRYVATEPFHQERARMGWSAGHDDWIRTRPDDDSETRDWLESAEVLLLSLRDFDLMERRSRKGLRTCYLSERWFKPPFGAARLLHPKYLSMCRRALRAFQSPHVTLLPIGIYAATDFLRLHDLLHARLVPSCHPAPPPYVPLARLVQDDSKTPDFARKLRLWGYFVEQNLGDIADFGEKSEKYLKVMWCGRMLGWKHVETLVAACRGLLEKGTELSLELIGEGPEWEKLKSLAGRWLVEREGVGIRMEGALPMSEIRKRMRSSDVYVLCSDGGEGWGAVANEALEEGCVLAGTQEAGSTATLIQDGHNGFLFPAKDHCRLAILLSQLAERKKQEGAGAFAELRRAGRETIRGPWNPVHAAEALFREVAP